MGTKTSAATPLIATRDFTDAGTGRRFTLGQPVDAEAGELANYQAAGLVAEAEAETPKPTAPGKDA